MFRPYQYLLKLFLLALSALMASRLIFAFQNPDCLPENNLIVALLQSLRYDLTALAWILLPVSLFYLYPTNATLNISFKKIANYLFSVIVSLALLFNLADAGWFAFQHKRSTADVFSVLSTGDDFRKNIFSYLVDYWHLVFIWLTLTFLVFSISKKLSLKKEAEISSSILHRIAAFVLVVTIYILSIRGGVQLKPLSTQVAATVAGPESAPFILNTPYTLIKSAGDRTLTEMHYMEQEIAEQIFPIHFNIQQDSAQQKNVILIILESFSKEYTGKSGNPSFTPFLDSLSDHSIYFENAFANAKRSIEGLPAVLTSIPALMDQPFITSPYNTNSINSLATLLKPFGYKSSFFHGGSNGTMGFDNFTAAAGYEKYYGRSQYDGPQQFDDGHWGIYDHAFYRFMIQQLNKETEPFTSAIFSLSSHHPYPIPADKTNLYKDGEIPILKSILYADDALRSFFAEASKQPWFEKTVFILTADHTGPAYTKYGQSAEGTYAIPLLIYYKGIQPKQIKDVAQQIDILPTALYLAGYNGEYASMGRNLMQPSQHPCAINYSNGNWQLFSNDQRTVFDGEELLSCESREKGKKHDCKDELLLLKAAIQQYNHAMISNSICR